MSNNNNIIREESQSVGTNNNNIIDYFDIERAETENLFNVDNRYNNNNNNDLSQQQQQDNNNNNNNTKQQQQQQQQQQRRLKDVARRVILLNRITKHHHRRNITEDSTSNNTQQSSNTTTTKNQRRHRAKTASIAHDILQAINEDDDNDNDYYNNINGRKYNNNDDNGDVYTTTNDDNDNGIINGISTMTEDILIRNDSFLKITPRQRNRKEQQQELIKHDSDKVTLINDDRNNDYDSLENKDEETVPLKTQHHDNHYGTSKISMQYQDIDNKKQQQQQQQQHYTHNSNNKKLYQKKKSCIKIYCIRIKHFIWTIYKKSLILTISIPCFIISWILFYYMGNPILEFLPGRARLGWWFNFFGRQFVLLEIARIIQYIIFQITYITVHILGPYVTFYIIQSKNWPFLLCTLSILDLLLLHGDNRLQAHWLYWTNLRIYSQANSGTYILASELYLRVLVSMLMLGTATAMKRTFFSIRFGKKQLAEFKPKLEKIMKEVALVSEVAMVGKEVAAYSLESQFAYQDVSIRKNNSGTSYQSSTIRSIGTFEWRQQYQDDESSVETHSSDEYENTNNNITDKIPEEKQHEGQPTSTTRSLMTVKSDQNEKLAKTDSGTVHMKDLMERWEEPTNDAGKSSEATIHDVIKFRRVLQFIDEETHPFGEAFGPASNRNECIDSSYQLFQNLMKLTPAASCLPFSTIQMVALENPGTIDDTKVKALRKIFRPDVQNELSMVAFMQSVDSVYKSLRYFRASVKNASVIDEALESIVNGAFYFVLLLILMAFMQMNPWPLLVSVSSILVSISFALGSSVSKYVEGALMIVHRRPYDLGDRIVIIGPEDTQTPGAANGYFVEDINLFTTVLRHARSNEISTVNNCSISASRIMNCNRSPSALVGFPFTTHISILDHGKLFQFRAALEKYVRDHPRRWDSLAYFGEVSVDPDTEKVELWLTFRHRNSWQDAGRIFLNKGKLLRFIYQKTKDLGVVYCHPPARQMNYAGGEMEPFHLDQYKSHYLQQKNLRPRMPSNNAAETTQQGSGLLF